MNLQLLYCIYNTKYEFDPQLYRGDHVILCFSLISCSSNKSTFLDPVCIICNWDSRLLPSVLKEVSLWENVWKQVTVYRRSWTVSEVFKLQFQDIKLNSDGSPNLFPICLWYSQHQRLAQNKYFLKTKFLSLDQILHDKLSYDSLQIRWSNQTKPNFMSDE